MWTLMLAHIHATPAWYALDYGSTPPVEDPAELLDWLRTELTEHLGTAGLTVQLAERTRDAARRLAELAPKPMPTRSSSVHPNAGGTASPAQYRHG